MSITTVGVSFTKTTFPGGETCIRLTSAPEDEIMIEMNFESNVDLFDLALLVDAIERARNNRPRMILFMPYVPYARQDRVCNEGESLSIKVACDFINGLRFHKVGIIDPHSDVTTALLNNVQVYDQSLPAESLFSITGDAVIIAPDAGAAKKAHKFAQVGGYTHYLKADKVRELSTGKIIGTSVAGIPHIGDKNFLIVDDICDGGRTFIELAKMLRPLTNGKIYLYVTHGIFSAGMKVFDGLIDGVYTMNPVGAKGEEAVASGAVTRI